jgi:hypothetical protein
VVIVISFEEGRRAILLDNQRAMTVRPRLFFLLLLAVSGVLLGWFGFFFFRDNFATHYPIKVLSAAAFRAGEIPWWNFADGGGQPLAGNPNTLTFYPDNFLYVLLPAHVAFNLHFLIHLALGWLAMKSLTRSNFGATLWVFSGVAISALSFYNLTTAIALVPFAFLAAERKSAAKLGLAFGLLALAGEPVTIAATAIAALILFTRSRGDRENFASSRLRVSIVSIIVATVIAAPQLIAYSEIANEVERAHRYSAHTVLSASFDPRRLLELIAGPFLSIDTPHLFPSLLIGLIVIPALFRRSRYTLIAAVMFFFALGSFNPIVRWLVESIDVLRAGRFPEKFALVMCAALVVLAAEYFRQSATPRIWAIVTFVPLLCWTVWMIPIDWFSPYRTDSQPAHRVFVPPAPGGQTIDRDSYRERARRLEPLFGATAGLEYVLTRSGDGMHSLLSRIAVERFAATHNPAWWQIAIAPPAIVPEAIAAPSIPDAVNLIESGAPAVAPRAFASAPGARVTRVLREGQQIRIDVASNGPSLLAVDQSYFRAWSARMGDRELDTLPINLDRLGVIVPASGTVTLRFGRHHTLVVVTWVLSSLLLAGLLVAMRIEEIDRRSGEVERTGDDDRAVA